MSGTTGDIPGVIARPPLIFLAAVAAGFALDWLWPLSIASHVLSPPLRHAGGGAAAALGIGVMAASIRTFLAAGTQVPTNRPATTIVSSGPYRFSRNPIYLGMTLIQIGIAIAADNPWILALLSVVLPIIRYGVIAREERYLEAKFGDAYRRYKATVRRWL